ncbi:MAG: ABC transporter ATP-binding protein [Catonella sp.]|uniref:ABC transporter ATP-binding protein n=1 Tax=Catonella sp. TaxID=2382125 RepID=UPI003FA0BD8D
MSKFFMDRYAMSELGANNLKKAIFSRTILNLVKMFPPIIAFMFLFQYLSSIEGIKADYELSFVNYIVVILVMGLIIFFVAGWDYTRLYTNVYNESANSRIDIANRLKKLPLYYFGKRDLSDLAETMMNDITLYEEIFSHAVPQLYATIISTIIISVMILSYNFKLGVATLWVIPVSIILFFLSKKKNRKLGDEWVKSSRAVYDDFQEKIDQIQEIKAYNLEETSLEEFDKKLNINKQNKIRTEFLGGISLSTSNILLKLGIVTVAIAGANMLIAGEINILVYIAFLILCTSIYLPIEGILTFMTMINMLDSVVGRIKEIKTMPVQEGKTEMDIKSFDVEFKDVHFGYDDYSVINGVSFTAKQGETTALIGPSGSGKTTLAKLAARFWDIDSGQILLGGEDISKVDPETLLKNFSIVFQDVTLFNASIKDNIRVGKKNATDEEILRAAKVARCDEFIKRMPEGIDTVIGENGERLSGGERQRLSIARAILKDAPVILLDEATASLDVENESLIQEALSELIKQKTVIIIAHRMRTIRSVDKIVLLNEGKIEAVGNDKELYEKSEMYRNMVDKAMV